MRRSELIFYTSSYSAHDVDRLNVALTPTNFRKSSYSGQGVNCVEVGGLPHGAAIRDSKHPDAGYLPFSTAEWTTFLKAAQL
ncbi:DUF397 domain-containing protein [Nocardiopsis sp. CNR-923]|uniref:DUF397 domain-containing protein n=1 Tax=Nocardiopsis sp. CNR-923 TaxID=1904965 RepID=UPI0009696CD8|nr:DUF397 domain-containing protein [Nocardiopsis sp. CNR-923]OLT27005.1 DUF397 domain-containing protein [Nocardiopsis sp. CNR-923]